MRTAKYGPYFLTLKVTCMHLLFGVGWLERNWDFQKMCNFTMPEPADAEFRAGAPGPIGAFQGIYRDFNSSISFRAYPDFALCGGW